MERVLGRLSRNSQSGGQGVTTLVGLSGAQHNDTSLLLGIYWKLVYGQHGQRLLPTLYFRVFRRRIYFAAYCSCTNYSCGGSAVRWLLLVGDCFHLENTRSSRGAFLFVLLREVHRLLCLPFSAMWC